MWIVIIHIDSIYTSLILLIITYKIILYILFHFKINKVSFKL